MFERTMTTDETRTTIDREMLIAICEAGWVPQSKWCNRDSCSAQRQLGEAYALLKAGCEFAAIADDVQHPQTIYICIKMQGFDFHEGGSADEDLFYLPTMKRIEEARGDDWY